MLNPKSLLRRDNILVFTTLAIPLLATNPPVTNWVNDYATDNPITIGLPTFWLWLQAWYAFALLMILIFAAVLPSWRTRELEEDVQALIEHTPKGR